MLNKDTLLYKILRAIKRNINFLALPHGILMWDSRLKMIRKEILSFIDNDKLILDVGSGSRPISEAINVIKMDIDYSCKINLAGDARKMPFKNNSFELVSFLGVLEHARNPAELIEETYRIIRTNGYIYIEAPFFCIYHGAPCDYQRFTLFGLEDLGGSFLKIKSGITSGPSVAFAHSLRIFLSLLFSLNNHYIYHFLYYYVFGWVALPFKFFDSFLINHPDAQNMSFIFYYLGRKVNA